ncbi:hypothetical protein B0H63DRAFT_523316 [Podospora didyma]|uniref:F-box domain-containing protein n=1 Tax=Podospora didyma TaxID=330526 RepID=A0AAE0NQS6_9PEZI|nr:hypothetical protein B0H63DRAFT_523316 [Podospora didyma]
MVASSNAAATVTRTREEDDAIMRTTIRNAADISPLLYFTRGENNAMREALLQHMPVNDNQANLGVLDRFPNEVLLMVFTETDLDTLFQLRGVNKRAHQFVTSIFEYRALVTHAINAFCVLLRTGSAKWITLNSIFQLMQTPNCAKCGRPSSSIYMPTAERFCLECCVRAQMDCDNPKVYCESGPFRTIAQVAGAVKLRLAAVRADKVPILRTQLAMYNSQPVGRREKLELVPYDAAVKYITFKGRPHVVGMVLLPYLVGDQKTVASLQVIPYFNCVGCERYNPARKVFSRVYTKQEFLAKHFEECPDAKHFWGKQNTRARLIHNMKVVTAESLDEQLKELKEEVEETRKEERLLKNHQERKRKRAMKQFW